MVDDGTAPQAPASPAALFWAFTWLALQGFGGVMAVVQRELVERRRWMTQEAFLQDWAAAQVFPGPNVVNLCVMFGERHFGLRGALAAMAGMLLAPTVLVLALGSLYLQWADHPAVAGALRGMGAVAAGLVLGTGIKLSAGLKGHPLPLWLGWALALAAFTLMVWRQWPLWWVLPTVGGLGCWLTWRRLS
ncbi:MAG: chromate transporter [Acidovorax sp.]|jgi:chromate transporter|nr:chromate transporter [Acidovorax sp.]MDR3003186.1 chromate transporter [Acidovorax sp.]